MPLPAQMAQLLRRPLPVFAARDLDAEPRCACRIYRRSRHEHCQPSLVQSQPQAPAGLRAAHVSATDPETLTTAGPRADSTVKVLLNQFAESVHAETRATLPPPAWVPKTSRHKSKADNPSSYQTEQAVRAIRIALRATADNAPTLRQLSDNIVSQTLIPTANRGRIWGRTELDLVQRTKGGEGFMKTNALLTRPRVVTLMIVSAMGTGILGTGIIPSRSALADLSPATQASATQTLSQSGGALSTNGTPTTNTGLWRIPHQGTRRDKRPRIDNDFAATSRPPGPTGSPTNLTIQDQSLGYQNLYADDDFQNLGGAGWVQTDQPPLADGEDSPQFQLNTTPVPLPGAVWLGALGLGSIAWIRRRTRS